MNKAEISRASTLLIGVAGTAGIYVHYEEKDAEFSTIIAKVRLSEDLDSEREALRIHKEFLGSNPHPEFVQSVSLPKLVGIISNARREFLNEK